MVCIGVHGRGCVGLPQDYRALQAVDGLQSHRGIHIVDDTVTKKSKKVFAMSAVVDTIMIYPTDII